MKKILLFSIIPFILMTSCISMQFANIDIQTPAKITYPQNVVNLAIVNNTRPNSDINDSTKNIQQIPLDSLCDVLIDSMAYHLDKQHFFGQVVSYPNYIRTEYSSNLVESLSKDQAQAICKEMQVEGLITVDLFTLNGSLTSYHNTYLMAPMDELALGIQVLLRSYTADGDEIKSPVFLNDTLYWQGRPDITRGEYALPSLDVAYSTIVDYAVENLIKAYIPSWKTEERVFFANGSSLMKKAAEHAKQNKWQDAISIWEEAYTTENDSAKKARTAYNLALGYEMTGNINRAMVWIRVAKSLEEKVEHKEIKNHINWYYAVLNKRQKQVDILNYQLGIDNRQADK